MDANRFDRYWPETLSVVRIIIALLFLEHGSAKLLGFPPPPNGHPAFMTLLWVQGVIELVGGALLAIGLFTRPVVLLHLLAVLRGWAGPLEYRCQGGGEF
jgi:putative oxidoreductase